MTVADREDLYRGPVRFCRKVSPPGGRQGEAVRRPRLQEVVQAAQGQAARFFVTRRGRQVRLNSRRRAFQPDAQARGAVPDPNPFLARPDARGDALDHRALQSVPATSGPDGPDARRGLLQPRPRHREASMGAPAQVASGKRVRRAIRPGEGRTRRSSRTRGPLSGGAPSSPYLQAQESSLRSPLFGLQRAARLAGEVGVYPATT